VNEPVGPENGRESRRALAERMGWPAQAVEVCERIEDERPGWYVVWSSGDDWEGPGFYAGRIGWREHDQGPKYLYGATADELRAAIESAPVVKRY